MKDSLPIFSQIQVPKGLGKHFLSRECNGTSSYSYQKLAALYLSARGKKGERPNASFRPAYPAIWTDAVALRNASSTASASLFRR